MTSPTARTWVDAVRPVAWAVLRSVAMITIATLLVLVVLPGALGAAGPGVPIAG